MKKLLVLAAALLLMVPASAMAGMTAFMDMDELSSSEMASTTGQAGITLKATAEIVTGGYIAWGDADGCTWTIGGSSQGWLTLSQLWSNGTVLDGLTVDVCTGEDSLSWLVIRIPSMTLNQGVGFIKIGSLRDSGDSLGELNVVSLSVANVDLRVRGHSNAH